MEGKQKTNEVFDVAADDAAADAAAADAADVVLM